MKSLLGHRPSLAGSAGGWQRHLDDLPLVVAAVGTAVLAAVLVLPRGAEPELLPLPDVDRGEIARLDAARAALAAAARASPLAFDARALGEALRRFGAAEAGGDPSAVELGRELPLRAREARARAGDPALLALRAVQTELFVEAALRWEDGAEADAELRELGGTFSRRAGAAGLLSRGRVALSRSALAVLFELRWAGLTGLAREPAFAPPFDALRLHHRIRLAPPGRDPLGDPAAAAAEVESVAALDPAYPAALARGVVALAAGRPAEAVPLLRAHLSDHPEGQWALRARNHLALAQQLVAASAAEEGEAPATTDAFGEEE